MDIKCYMVTSFIKGKKDPKNMRHQNLGIDHSYNVVNIYGYWYTIDVTWNTVQSWDDKQFLDTDHHGAYWFCTKPQYFIDQHFPEDPKWQ